MLECFSVILISSMNMYFKAGRDAGQAGDITWQP